MRKDSSYVPFEGSIQLSHGRTLLIQQNSDPKYRNEVFIGLGDEDGVWIQELVCVRQAFDEDGYGNYIWKPGAMNILIATDGQCDAYTEEFDIFERKEEE